MRIAVVVGKEVFSLSFSVSCRLSTSPFPLRTQTMKSKKLNTVHVWKQFEDVLAPRLRWLVIDRAVYSYLLRHSRLEGKVHLHFSILWLADNIGLTVGPVRDSVRRFIEQGVFRLIDRSSQGHVVEVRLPEEVRAVRGVRIGAGGPAGPFLGASLDNVNFLRTRALRRAIHAREGGLCFYCLRRSPAGLAPWTTWCRAWTRGAIPTATWFLAVWRLDQGRTLRTPSRPEGARGREAAATGLQPGRDSE
jgi:hypothetical protein